MVLVVGTWFEQFGNSANNFCAGFFYKIIAVQKDGSLGMLFSLRVAHLMCTRCVTVRRVCFKESRRLKMAGETYSKVKRLSSQSAVEITSMRQIESREGGVAPSKLISRNCAHATYMGLRSDCNVYRNSVIEMM